MRGFLPSYLAASPVLILKTPWVAVASLLRTDVVFVWQFYIDRSFAELIFWLLLPAFGSSQSVFIDLWLFSGFCIDLMGFCFPAHHKKKMAHSYLQQGTGPPKRRANFNNHCELFNLLKGKAEVIEDIATVIIWYHIYWFSSPLNHCLGLGVKLVFTLLTPTAAFNALIPYLTFLQFSTCPVSVRRVQAFSVGHLNFDLSERWGIRASSLLPSLLEPPLCTCKDRGTQIPVRLLLHSTNRGIKKGSESRLLLCVKALLLTCFRQCWA